MVVNPYLFGMTTPHERNRYCNNSRAKNEPGHWSAHFETRAAVQIYREDHLQQPAVKTGFRRHTHEGHGVEIKVADLA